MSRFLSYPGAPNSEDFHCCIFYSVNNREAALFGGNVRSNSQVMHELEGQLGKYISAARVATQVNGFRTEYRMDVYVFSPEVFDQVVEHEVERRIGMQRYLDMKVTP